MFQGFYIKRGSSDFVAEGERSEESLREWHATVLITPRKCENNNSLLEAYLYLLQTLKPEKVKHVMAITLRASRRDGFCILNFGWKNR